MDDEQLSLGQAVILHLLPGIAIVVVFVVLSVLFRSAELPALFFLALAVPLGMLPTELGFLLYQGKKRSGRYSLDGVLAYQQPLGIGRFALICVGVFVGAALLFAIGGETNLPVFNALFGWWPDWLNLDKTDLTVYSRPIVIVTLILSILFTGIIGPWVEELYFRGYLLPRLNHFGIWGNLLNAFLFAVYHFWTPWRVIERTIGTLPLIFAAKRGNLNVAIAVHAFANTIGLIGMGVAALQAIS